MLQIATPSTLDAVREGRGGRARQPRRAAWAPAWTLRALGAVGLLGVLATSLLVAAGAAGSPNRFVPARSGGWPDWLAGPLAGLHLGLPGDRFQTLTLLMAASYALALAGARALPLRALAATVVAAHVIFVLGPPLLSQDLFGYLAYARMGAEHGLDPYTHFPSEAATDPVFQFLGWPFQHSPYGPLFTLGSYAVAPLGLAGSMWVVKALAGAASLGAVALVAIAAARAGRSRRFAIVFFGLNPVLLEVTVGGAHNDTLILLAIAAALALTAGPRPRLRAGAASLAAGVGVKVTAAVLLPFLALAPREREQRRAVVVSAAATLGVLAAVALIGFGTHALGFVDALSEQQQLVATHSIPAETARLVGLSGTPAWWRHLYVAAFVLVFAIALWRTARGADWRVAAGWTLLALLLSTAWLLPWYATWPLPLAAVCGDRRLRAAVLAFTAYALVIHLSFADPLLAPRAAHVPHHLAFPVPGVRHRLEFTSFEMLRHVQLYLRW
jgi:hypothetical protein